VSQWWVEPGKGGETVPSGSAEGGLTIPSGPPESASLSDRTQESPVRVRLAQSDKPLQTQGLRRLNGKRGGRHGNRMATPTAISLALQAAARPSRTLWLMATKTEQRQHVNAWIDPDLARRLGGDPTRAEAAADRRGNRSGSAAVTDYPPMPDRSTLVAATERRRTCSAR
jgi:hypothetical protein